MKGEGLLPASGKLRGDAPHLTGGEVVGWAVAAAEDAGAATSLFRRPITQAGDVLAELAALVEPLPLARAADGRRGLGARIARGDDDRRSRRAISPPRAPSFPLSFLFADSCLTVSDGGRAAGVEVVQMGPSAAALTSLGLGGRVGSTD